MWLKSFAEPCCVQALNASNVKEIWQAGRLYESDFVKKGCIQFAHTCPLAVLTQGNVQLLQTEDPASWEEFARLMSEKDTQQERITFSLISSQDGDETFFRMGLEQKIEKAFVTLAQRKGVARSSLKFYLNDILIVGDPTCHELRLDAQSEARI